MALSLAERAWISLRWRTRRATAALRGLPDFLLIGAARAGTTGLYHALCSHPDVRPPFRKEPRYFGASYERGTRWYRAHFPLRHRLAGGRMTGDATTSYLPDSRVPRRARGTIPEAHLLALLREPVARAHSHWRLRVATGREDRSFEEIVAPDLERGHLDPTWDRGTPYLPVGAYAHHLQRWLSFFPRSRLHVVISEDLWADPRPEHARILDFLGLRPWRLEVVPGSNAAPGPPLDPSLRRDLEALYAPHNARLADLLRRDPGW